MQNRFILSILTVAAILAVSPVLLSQTAERSEVTRDQTAARPPDLTGVWMPGRGPGRGFADPKDVPPMGPWAEEKWKVARQGVTDPAEQGVVESFSDGPSDVMQQLLKN